MENTYDTYLCRPSSRFPWIAITNPDGSITKHYLDKPFTIVDCSVDAEAIGKLNDNSESQLERSEEYKRSAWAFRAMGLVAAFLIGFTIYIGFKGVN